MTNIPQNSGTQNHPENTFSIELAQELLNSSDKFPVDFDKAWVWLGYSRKDSAKEALTRSFVEGVDFQIELEPITTGISANPRQIIKLTCGCFKKWGMMAGTAKGELVREYFLECEERARHSLNFNEKLDKILSIAEEYEILKVCTKKELPGLNTIITAVAGQKALPPASVWFSASEWINRNASHLTTRQRSNFFKDIAASHRLLIDEPPIKVKNGYIYNNRHEFLFWQKLDQIQRHVPVDAEAIKGEKDFNKTKLTGIERTMLGKNSMITKLVQQLGYCTKANPDISYKVKLAIVEAAENKQLRLRWERQYVQVTEKVLKFIKWWLLNNV